MNILFINSIGKNKWGGGEKWMLTAAEGLKNLGHSVTVSCRKNSIVYQNATLRNLSTIHIISNIDFDICKIKSLHRFCKENRINVIIGCLNKDIKTAGLMSKLFGGPLIISRQGVPQITKLWKYKVVFKYLCDGMVTNTYSIKEIYDSYKWWNKEFIEVIYNGLEMPEPSKTAYNYPIPNDIKREDAKIVLSAGRLALQKGYNYLIDAAKIVNLENKNILFYIAGEGKLKEKLQKQISENGLENRVFLIGFEADIKPLFQSANLLVLSSLYEGMPNIVMEAMAYGLPVISTKVNGVDELIGDESCGGIIEPANPQIMAKEIVSFFTKPTHIDQIRNAKARVQNNFSVEQMSMKLERYLLKKLEMKAKKRVLIIQTAFIGDVVLITPLIETLAHEHPNWDIDILVRSGNEAILANNPKLNEVLVFDKKNGKYRNLINLIKKIRGNRYDEVVNIQRYFTTGLITALSGAKSKSGFNKNPLSIFYTHKVSHQMGEVKTEHEVERNLKTIEHLITQKIIQPKIYPSTEDYKKVERSNRYVTMAPSSVWFTKALPTHKWLELMTLINEETDILLLGGKGDAPLCQNLIELSGRKNVFNLAGGYSLLQSAALMQNASMNYVNDSGPLHLASAVNAPVRAFFCSTVKEFGYTPLSSNSKVIEVDEVLDCRPCGLHGKRSCPKGHFKCGEIDVKKALV